MLHRPPSRRSTPAVRKARYRKRLRGGRVCVMVEIDCDLVDWLTRMRWLDHRNADDRAAIGAAIERLLRDAARG
jgi:hypothetical protein